jgi:peptidyl-prolyl cis-trans isomerase SurA
MPRPVVAALALLGLAISASSSGAHADEPRARVARAPVPLDGIAAIVDDVFIFRSEVAARAKRFEATLSHDPTKRRSELAAMHKQLLARMIDELLVTKDAKALHIEVTEAEVNAGVASVAQANNMDRKALEAEVKKAGFSRAEYEEEIKRQIAEQRWLVARAAGKIDRKKAVDNEAFAAAVEKQREILLADLRSRAFIEIR